MYDGNNTDAPLKKACSGSYSAGSYVISSSGNSVLLHFTSDSDGATSHSGFNIKFNEGMLHDKKIFTKIIYNKIII